VFSGPHRDAPVVAFDRPVVNDNLALGLALTDDPDMSRVFSLPKAMRAQVSGYAVPMNGTPLERLLEEVAPPPSGGLRATASSWLGSLPRFRPENLVDDAGSPWIAEVGDTHPSVDLSWPRKVSVSAVSLALASQASRPTEITITSPAGSRRDLKVPKEGGLISFRPLVTNNLRVGLVKVAPKRTFSSAAPDEFTVPVGLSAVSIPALDTRPVPAPGPDQPVHLGCGQGPTAVFDGTTYQTSVRGTVGDLIDFKPLRFTACGPYGVVPLAAGTQTFSAGKSSAPFEITSLIAQEPTAGSPAPAPARRTAKIVQWNTETRTMSVSAGPATYLVVSQNYNAGWVATLGSQTLEPVRIDGWQQGYVVPAGKAGTVTMVMAPDRLFRLFLALGAAFLIGLFLLAILRDRKASPGPTVSRRMPSRWLLMAGALVVLGLVVGPLALVAVPLVLAARRWGTGLMAVIAFAAFTTAGALAAWQPAALQAASAGAFGLPAQVCSGIALAAVLSALVAGAGWPGSEGVAVTPEL